MLSCVASALAPDSELANASAHIIVIKAENEQVTIFK